MDKLRGIYLLDSDAFELVYGPTERADIDRLVNLYAPPQTRTTLLQDPRILAPAEVIISGWGAPVLDDEFLATAPRLKAFFYGGGAMGSVLTPAVWERGVVATSAIEANAVPVAEYTLAAILFSLKHGWSLARQTRYERRFVERNGMPGCYGSTVGLVSLGAIARALLKLFEPLDLRVIVYDPFLTQVEAKLLGVECVSLDEVFRSADVVSLHTPLLPETENLVTGAHLSSMKQGAAFINTARGEVVREDELIEVARRREDLQFVLDVSSPEPPAVDSPLFDLPNVVLTPHIAGSAGNECRRMGRYIVEELERFITGQPLKWAVQPDKVQHTSHRPLVRVSVAKDKRRAIPMSAARRGR